MPLYKYVNNQIQSQVKQSTFTTERELQRLFEQNLDSLLGVRFVASECSTGDRQRGRIDTIGLDQDNYPTIIEYKKKTRDNVINQGLFYLDWLVDHKGDFTMTAQARLGADVIIDWSHPRLILIAESFSDYDKYAVNRIGANIELWTYIKYGDGLIYVDPLFLALSRDSDIGGGEEGDYTIDYHTRGKPSGVLLLFNNIQEKIFQLSNEKDIAEKANKHYISYKHGKNFCEIHLQTTGLKIWLDISIVELKDPFSLARDVSNVGHHGTGQVEVKLSQPEDIERVMDLIDQSYQMTV